jgi:pimeloyl-ACP methyl ester carboxylesterase
MLPVPCPARIFLARTGRALGAGDPRQKPAESGTYDDQGHQGRRNRQGSCDGLQGQVNRFDTATFLAMAAVLLLSACATLPTAPFDVELPPGVDDARGRFAEIFCSVLERDGASLPGYRPCTDALSHVTSIAPGTGRTVDLGPSHRRYLAAVVPGVGYSCIAEWLQPATTPREHLARFAYETQMVEVDALSGTAKNAGQIRDAVMALPREPGPPRVVLVGYSKGAPDVLEALVRYPELGERVVAFVSIAGAVGGSPLANDATQRQADLLRHWPKAKCDAGDGGAVASLRTDVRKAWLATNRPPPGIRLYTLVTLPDRDRISEVLVPTYKKLAKIDPRNDGQVIYSDQIVPGSTLLGFLNADHWAVVLPIDRSHRVIGSTLANHGDYPREALLESLLRYVEEDLAANGK